MQFYPVIVTVYDRLDLLQKCIENLLKNNESKNTILYISSDAPFKESDTQKVELVRSYIKTGITGFKSIIPVFHKKNLGSHNAGSITINQVLSTNEAFIFLEDDIMVSQYFLKFMNTCLNTFKDRPDIYFVCSYTWPRFDLSKVVDEDTFLWKSYCPWGMASWKEKWQSLDFELKNFSHFFKNKKLVRNFNRIDPNTILILKDDIAGKIVATDARISLNLFLNQKLSIFPSKSLSLNIGHDGRGVHGSTNSIYMNQTLTEFNPRVCSEIKIKREIQNYIFRFKYSFFRHEIYYPLNSIPFFRKLNINLKRILHL